VIPCAPIRGFLVLLAAATAQAGPLQNGDFEQPFGSEWTAKDATPAGGTLPAPNVLRVPGAHWPGVGQWVIETTGRDHVQDGPVQSNDGVLSQLRSTLASPPYGNGRTYTTRVWVKLDGSAQEASFRCLLRWRDNGVQQIPLILAEVVIIESGVWVEAIGTVTLTWATSLSSAAVDFEVEQLHKGGSPTPPPQWFPGYQMDDLRMELDGDGDGLWDSEESGDHAQAAVSFSDSADSDGDRMTDDWERAHGLDPRDPGDAALDPDGDEFSNVQEYFGATDPQSPLQFPGKPSDPLATHQTRALLRYLALRPWQQKVLVGQMVEDNANSYAPFITALAAQPVWGRWPSILGLQVEKQNAPLDIAASMDHAIIYANEGGIPQLKWAMWNPWTGGNMGDINKIDLTGLLDPDGTPTIILNTAQDNLDARAVLIGWIDAVAAEIQRYNAATDSQPLLFRPLSEMNGGWFWWGHRTRAEYLGLWNFVRDRLMTHHGLHNIIWVCESAQTEHMHPVPSGTASASDYYYPGDASVDVMSHNLYDDDWVLPWDANKIYSRYPKIYGVPQAGPGKSTPTSRDGHFDTMNYITQIAARYPRLSFFIVWDSFTSHDDDDNDPFTPSNNDDADPNTPDTPTYKNLAIIDSTNPDQLMTDSRVITRDELGWRAPANPSVSAESSSGLGAAWADISGPGQDESGFRLEVSAEVSGPWSIAVDTPPNATGGTAAGLAAASVGWVRVRSLFGNGDDSLATDPLLAMTWSHFQQWKSDTLGDFNAPDLADDDRDGAVTLMEYALATDPFADSSAEMPQSEVMVLGEDAFLTLSFRRRSGPGGLTYTVEASGGVAAGQWMAEPVPLGMPVDNGDGTEGVTYRDIVPVAEASRRFMRLRVSAP